MVLKILILLAAFPVMFYVSWWQGLFLLFLPVIYALVRPWYLMLYYRNQGVPYLNRNPFMFDASWLISEGQRISRNYDRFFTRIVGPHFFITLLDPELIKEFLQNKEQHFVKSHPYLTMLKLFFGEGLIFSTGEIWKSERRVANKAFHHEKMLKMAGLIEERVNLKLQDWKDRIRSNNGNPIDVNWAEESIQMTLDVIGVCAFGQKCSTYTRDGKTFSIPNLTRSLSEDIMTYGATASFLLCPKKVNFKLDEQSRSLHAKSKLMKSIGKEIIRNRIQELKQNPALISGQKDLLNLMLAAHLEDRDVSEIESLVDLDLLVDECITFIVAGSDTTSGLITWFFYNMSKYPEILSKVREEVQKVLGEKFAQDPEHIISYEVLDKMPYLSRTIKETLRLFPSVPRITGRVAQKDVLLGKLKVKKGTLVAVNPYLVHHNGFYWKDPETFNPDREEYENGDLRFMPFSTGKRSCIGQFFALMEAKIAITKILLELNIQCDLSADKRLATTLTLYAKEGVPSTISLLK